MLVDVRDGDNLRCSPLVKNTQNVNVATNGKISCGLCPVTERQTNSDIAGWFLEFPLDELTGSNLSSAGSTLLCGLKWDVSGDRSLAYNRYKKINTPSKISQTNSHDHSNGVFRNF